MTEAQRLFDRYAAPACPDQLTAPSLHRVLAHPALAPHVLGGKGVGSQGDGSVQFLARDEESQEAAIRVLTDELGLSCLRLTVARSKKVRKAVITAAGFGTRLFPMTSAVRKEFLPVVDRKGRMLPLILANVEEAVAAGIEEICIIIQEQDRRLFEDFFRQNLPPSHYEKLSAHARQSLEAIKDLGRRVVLHAQDEQTGPGTRRLPGEGLGRRGAVPPRPRRPPFRAAGDRAAARSSSWTGSRRWTLRSSPSSPRRQRRSAGSGPWEGSGLTGEERRDLIEISMFKEKPDREFAAEYLAVDGLPEDTYLTVFGLYILPPESSTSWIAGRAKPAEDDREVQLTDALERLRRGQRFLGLVIDGEKIDVGLPEGYLSGLMKFAGRA